MKSVKYKSIEIKTKSDLKNAERLKKDGWVLYSLGLFTLHFYKKE